MAKLYFKYGAMGSSKTATALITKYNYEERGMKVWLIKPSADSRDGQFTLKSRIGLSSECEAIGPEIDIRTLYHARQKVDVIIVDECQFMTMAQIDQLRELVDRVLRGEIPDAKTQAAALRVWCMLQEGKLS